MLSSITYVVLLVIANEMTENRGEYPIAEFRSYVTPSDANMLICEGIVKYITVPMGRGSDVVILNE